MSILGSLGKAAAKAVRLEAKIPQILRGVTRPIVKPLRTIKQWFHTSRDGKIHFFRNIRRGWKANSTRRWNNVRKFMKSPFKSTGRAIKNLAIGLAMGYVAKKALGKLMGGENSNGNINPSAGSFDTPPIAPIAQSGTRGNIDTTPSTKGKSTASRANDTVAKVNLNTKIAEAKAGMVTAQKTASQIGVHHDQLPDKIETIYAKGKSTDDKLDAIITLLNKGNEISNESRRLHSQSLKIEEQKIKSELIRSSELYRNLMKMQAQQNSANADAVKTAVAESTVATTTAIGNQTKEYKQAVKENKKSSMMKWLLFGGMLMGINSLVKSFGGFSKVWSEATDHTGNVLKHIGTSIGLIKEDLDTAVAAGEKSYNNVQSPHEGKGDSDENSFGPEIEQDEKTQNAIDKTIDKAEQREGSQIGKTGADAALTATMGGQAALSATNQVKKLTHESRLTSSKKGWDKAKFDSHQAMRARNVAQEAASASETKVKEAKSALDKAKESYKSNPNKATKKALDQATKSHKSAVKEHKANTKALNKASKAVDAAEARLDKAFNKHSAIKSRTDKLSKVVDGIKSKASNSLIGKMSNTVADKVKNSTIAKSTSKMTDKLKQSLLGKMMKTLGVKLAAKGAGKLIPGLGLGIGAISAAKRLMRGDWIGAFGDISSAAVAQAGYLGTVFFPGVATVAGMAASAGIDALVAMHDRKKAEEAIENGDIKTLVALGFEWGDLAALVYGLEGDPEYEGLPTDNPLRQALDQYFPTIQSIIKAGGNWTAVLGTASQLRDCKIKNEFDKNYSTIEGLKKLGLSWTEIAEVVNATPDGHPLREEFLNALDANSDILNKIMSSNSRLNNNSITMANIMKKAPDSSKAKQSFINQVGDIDKFIESESKVKNSWGSKALKWITNGAKSIGDGVNWARKKSWELVKSGGQELLNIGNDVWADVAGLFGGGKDAKKAKEERLAKAKQRKVMTKMADAEGILLSEGGKERGSVDFEDYYKLNKDKIDKAVSEAPDEKSTWDKYKGAYKWVGNTAKKIGKGAWELSNDYLGLVDWSEGKPKWNKTANGLYAGAKAIGNGVSNAWNWLTGGETQDWENIPHHAHGTNYHPGGAAVVGDGGKHELVITPDNKAHITPDKPTLVDLPRGSRVIPEVDGKIPAYANGTDNPEYIESDDVVDLAKTALDKSVTQNPDLMSDNDKRLIATHNWLKSNLNLNDEQAAGIAGVMYAESGIKPGAVNIQERDGTATHLGIKHLPKGYGAGICQWTEPRKGDTRKTKVLEFINKKFGKNYTGIEQATLEEQLHAFKNELETERPKTLQLLKNNSNKEVSDLIHATDIMLRGYENGGNGKLASIDHCNKYTWANEGQGGYHGLMYGKRNGRVNYANKILSLSTGKKLSDEDIKSAMAYTGGNPETGVSRGGTFSDMNGDGLLSGLFSGEDFSFDKVGDLLSKGASMLANTDVYRWLDKNHQLGKKLGGSGTEFKLYDQPTGSPVANQTLESSKVDIKSTDVKSEPLTTPKLSDVVSKPKTPDKLQVPVNSEGKSIVTPKVESTVNPTESSSTQTGVPDDFESKVQSAFEAHVSKEKQMARDKSVNSIQIDTESDDFKKFRANYMNTEYVPYVQKMKSEGKSYLPSREYMKKAEYAYKEKILEDQHKKARESNSLPETPTINAPSIRGGDTINNINNTYNTYVKSDSSLEAEKGGKIV